MTVRARGRTDLARELERHGFSKASVREALERLSRERLLDDLGAARSLVRAKSGRYGRTRIARELSSRGFSEETVAAALSELAQTGEEKTLERAFAKLWAATAGLPREKRRRRVWSALIRRGFAGAAISAMMGNSDEDDEIGGDP